ncbi:uncharacterized protein BDR25DRAFT_381431 [Lindgomyces ingoldianus]|uniref:Uncharacterized protein n=1 Tax=Lindgomyces ingoldianus TaxID=673940 RepID=A0ACB6QDU2_9PLEO|nr:uncharacterized protein BDR25DRAFT_381431 [Lindgomyces ingoldianus]KAF2464316.1 hypothetical protein BDR25DRAFT_381431 [Lindgomyces ingoldianus]
MASGDRVPEGMWFCCSCKNPNIKALTSTKCSNCTHEKDASCADEGDKKPLPTGVSSVPIFDYYQSASKPGFSMNAPGLSYALSHPPQVHCNYARQFKDSTSILETIVPNFPDAWTCPGCGASNSGLTPNFCPVCDWKAEEPSTLARDSHDGVPINSIPETPNDVWVCSSCSAVNCDWLDFCPICGTSK